MQRERFGRVELEAGGVLAQVEVGYETWGALNRTGDNAILITHALTGDTHAYDEEAGDGWWQGLIGPGKPLDTDRYYIVCSNVLGGSGGTTGPASIDPQTGRPYGPRFPLVTIGDMVRVQHLLLQHLQVSRLALVIGGSMGGLQAIEWAAAFPERVERCMPIATSAKLSALAIAYNDAMRMAIQADPAWQGGDYAAGEGPVQGLILARKIGMITYRTYDLFEERFGRETVRADVPLGDTRFQIESYLDYQGEKLTRRFDANAYLTLLKAMDLHDIGRGRGGITGAFARITGRVCWVGIDSDRLYPVREQRMWAERLREGGCAVEYREIVSPFGHDAFLLEFEQMGAIVEAFLGGRESM
ncbi:MAG TPA: homoserine O-acetyltransferase [Bacilli bacterium]|nr:homoserine O-acetyltransferase [Bacilli bacterium]